MAQRRISEQEVEQALESGEVIEEYPEDTPYPSRLYFKVYEGRPIHVVAANNEAESETIIISAYEPDPKKWEPDFKRRKGS